MFDHYDAHGLPISCTGAEQDLKRLREDLANAHADRLARAQERDAALDTVADLRAALAGAEQATTDAQLVVEAARRVVHAYLADEPDGERGEAEIALIRAVRGLPPDARHEPQAQPLWVYLLDGETHINTAHPAIVALLGVLVDDGDVSFAHDVIARWQDALAADVPAAADRPRIVCLCGSTRFPAAFEAATKAETLAGRIVVSIGCNLRTDPELAAQDEAEDGAIKRRLDDLHKRKIDLADEVLVVSDESGYIGDSTRSEIAYAQAHGKPIRWLEPVPAAPASTMDESSAESQLRISEDAGQDSPAVGAEVKP